MAAVKANMENKCGCLHSTCKKDSNGECDDPACKNCKVCCTEECPGCKQCTKKGECKCRLKRCGCAQNCYGENGEDKECKGNGTCDRCERKCKNNKLGNRCICANCNCGCSYGLCNCCPWCKRNYCTGDCDGYVIGRCAEGKCQGHYKYEGAEGHKIPNGEVDDVRPAVAPKREGKLCLYNCTACGRLCAKHICHCIGSIFITIAAIVFTIFIAWNKYPERFRRVYYDLRGALVTAPGHPDRSPSNLVGVRIPVETNIDRYPAFRPRTYAGLS